MRKMIRHVPVPRFPDYAHRQIRRLLEQDEERRQKQLASRFPSSWDAPLFDDAFEIRRLRVLNAIMTALEKAGMKPSVGGKDARDLDVTINDTRVHFRLDATSQKPDPYRRSAIETRGASNKLRFELLSSGHSSGVDHTWEDTDKAKLETHLTEIVIELIIAGERHHRDWCQRHYEWMVKRKADVIEEIRKRKEEAERKERERIAALEQARVDRLLGNADAYRQASAIRAYVADVEERYAAGDLPVSESELETWKNWALAQAARIDPVNSGRFIESMKDRDISPGENDEGT